MTYLPLETEGCKNNTGYVHITLRWGKKQYILHIWMCVCSLRCPACNAHAPHCHLCPVWVHSIFPHHLINCTTSGKKVIEHKMFVLIFYTISSETLLQKKWAVYDHICILVFMLKYHYSCQDVAKLEFSW
jgi:hypothetical protein